jgi:hypothetical protein
LRYAARVNGKTIRIKFSLHFLQTYSAISKNENSGSRESLPSQFPAGGSASFDGDTATNGHRRTFSDQVKTFGFLFFC